jgi:hypothetical protein
VSPLSSRTSVLIFSLLQAGRFDASAHLKLACRRLAGQPRAERYSSVFRFGAGNSESNDDKPDAYIGPLPSARTFAVTMQTTFQSPGVPCAEQHKTYNRRDKKIDVHFKQRRGSRK